MADSRTQRPAFGAFLRQRRIDAGLTQEMLAERARISVQAVSALERGARGAPRSDTLSLLSEALELRDEALVDFEAAARSSVKPKVRTTQPLLSAPNPRDQPLDNLPQQPTSFVGREKEVAEITALLRDNRLVTLVGTGGIGKTRTALHVATNLLAAASDGVWFVELAALQDASLLANTVAAAIGIALPGDREPNGALVNALGSKHMLLVIDNCEHLIAEAARLVAAIVRSTPRVHVLATSRQDLGITGENAYRMPTLAIPSESDCNDGMTAPAALRFGAVALFTERAQAADARFALTDGNAPIVAEIVRRLDGIALAIELAASRIKVLDVTQLSQRLDERFRLLAGGSRDVLPRQQTLRALIDWSYDLLDEREKLLFARVGIFADGFTLEAARAVCGEDERDEFEFLGVLSSLVEKSVVMAERSDLTTRYRLLESIRAYALEKLEASCARGALAARHLAWVDEFTEAAYDLYDAKLDATLAERFPEELGNIRASLAWAREAAQVEALARIIVRIGNARTAEMPSSEMLSHLAFARRGLPQASAELLAAVRLVEGAYLGNLDRDAESLASYTAAVEYATQSGAEDLIGSTHSRRSQVYAKLGGYAEAASDLRIAAQHEGKLSEREADVLRSAFAIFATVSGDYEEALRQYELSFARHRELGVPIRYGVTLGNIAALHIQRRDWSSAIAAAREALAIAKGESRIKSIGNLVVALNESGKFAEARSASREGVRLTEAREPGGLHATSAIAEAVFAIAEIDAPRAARLLAYAADRIPKIGGTFDDFSMTRSARLTAELHQKLGVEEFDRLSREGRALLPERAFEEAMLE